MNIELLNTGSELMLGRVLNTHQQWLCRHLADLGYVVTRQVAVPDTAPDIQSAVREALSRADLIITTGGLGPTSDDLTRDLIAQLLGKKLRRDDGVLDHIKRRFAARNLPMPKNNEVQALVPEGALVLANPNGTAPGLAMKITPSEGRVIRVPNPNQVGDSQSSPLRTQWLVMLPGPPRELRPMFTDQVMPLLRREFPLKSAFVCRTLRTTGLGESLVEERIDAALRPLVAAGLELGYCAHSGEVDVRVVTRGPGAEKLAAEAEGVIREKLGHHIFGTQDDQLNEVVVRLLTKRRETLALAESCTGGFVASRITDVPGASAVFLAGVVTYSNEAKQNLLGVRAKTLAQEGAVSEAVAREMAEGARKRFGTDYGIGITGIAGPAGGTDAKPVGTVFIALATARHTFVLNPVNRYDRPTFKHITCQQALELLRRALLGPA